MLRRVLTCQMFRADRGRRYQRELRARHKFLERTLALLAPVSVTEGGSKFKLPTIPNIHRCGRQYPCTQWQSAWIRRLFEPQPWRFPTTSAIKLTVGICIRCDCHVVLVEKRIWKPGSGLVLGRVRCSFWCGSLCRRKSMM